MSAVVTVVLVALVTVIAALVAGILLAPARVRITVDGGDLVVGLGFWDRVAAVHGPLRVPLERVESVRVVDRSELTRPGPRFPGSHVPGVVIAGSYGFGEKRTFWDVRRAPRVLVVECRPGWSYARLLLEVPDPEKTAAELAVVVGRG